MNKRVIIASVITSIIAFLVSPIIVGAAIPSQYYNTYYAELDKMYNNLKTNEKKIIFVGSSSSAFGLNVDVIERSFPDYKICPFGLYGQIGTKAMMDYAIKYVNEGDIVILSPEISEQSMSLYFSGEEIWKCADMNLELAFNIDIDKTKDMLGSYYPYLGKKVTYFLNGAPDPDDVYSAKSFDEKCQMIYDRPYNIMPEFCDYDNIIDFNLDLINDEFINYVNEYNQKILSKNARLYYNYCPINNLAITSMEDAQAFSKALHQKLDCFILGSINDYLMDYEWFYDNNFHLNSYGSLVYSYQLVDDLKIEFKDFSIELRDAVEKPIIQTDLEDGDNSDLDCFEYEPIGNGYKVTKLKESFSKRTRLVIPTSYEGKPILTFDKKVFYGNSFIEEIVIPKTVTKIEDYSFVGCTSLKYIYLESEIPNSTVSTHLIEGAQNAMFVVKNYEAYCLYVVNYYWSQYASRITYFD